MRRRRSAGAERDEAATWLRHGLGTAPVSVAFVLPEPTPYRNPMLDLLADRDEVDVTAVYAGGSVQQREWELETAHRSVVLEGHRIPGARRILRHDYPVTPGVLGALRAAQPGVVVVSGWSTFASQAAIAWCRLRRVPYVLVVESNDRDQRPGWRRAVKAAIVPSVNIDGGVFGLLGIALIFGLVNAILGPILRLVSAPLTLVTLGLFSFVVNGVLLAATAGISDNLDVGGFLASVVAALLISIVTAVLTLLVPRLVD